jgi:hypothetical protein
MSHGALPLQTRDNCNDFRYGHLKRLAKRIVVRSLALPFTGEALRSEGSPLVSAFARSNNGSMEQVPRRPSRLEGR